MKLSSFFRSALFFSLVATFGAACLFAPVIKLPDAGRPDGGVQPATDSGVKVDGGLLPGDACALLNSNRCAFLAGCGLIADEPQAKLECVKYFEATWCGPMTWPSHVAAGTLKYEPARAEACAQAFASQACGEWNTLPDSCTRFLVPRVALGGDCYDGFAECTDGVCRGSSCPRTCQPRALLDDPCSADGECRSGLYCKLSPFIQNAGRCAAYGTNGTACENTSQCLDGLQCLAQMCRVLPMPGSACVEGQCSETGYCEGPVDAGACLERKQEGAACAGDECESELVCDPIRAVCLRVRLSSGEACSLAQQCPLGEVCVGSTAQSAGSCQLPQAEGEPCATHGECDAHLACQDADGGRTCQRRAEAGVTCDSAEVCQAGSVCASSTCTQLPLPGQSCAQTRECRWGLCRELANTDGGAVCGPLLSAALPCTRDQECASGSCSAGTCMARCVP